MHALRGGYLQQILVEEGDIVWIGKPLFKVKREGKDFREIVSRDNGKVIAIHVKEQRTFDKNELLITIDTNISNERESKRKGKEKMDSFSSQDRNEKVTETKSDSKSREEVTPSKKSKVEVEVKVNEEDDIEGEIL